MGRQKANIHYLYKTTCNVTGRYYVGMHSTSNLEDGYLGSGKRLRYSLRKHGKENHVKEIIEFFESRELLINAEKAAITGDMLVDTMCMNIMSGGTGGFISQEKQRHRSSCGGKANAEKFKNDDEYRLKMCQLSSETFKKTHKSGKIKYNTFTNLKHSDETKLLMSQSSKGMGLGENNSQYGTQWITNSIENRKIKKNANIPEGWYKGRII